MLGYRVHCWDTEPTWEEIPDPTPQEDEVLVQVEACGVGLTVLNCIAGDLSNDPGLLPRVPGHELVGRVVDSGPGAGRPLIGRRVVAYFYLVCGSCRECMTGRESRCIRLRGWVGVHINGGYAPYAVLPARNAIAVPDELDPVSATVVPDAVATPVHVCRQRANVVPEDRVAVIGAGGGVGIHMVQVAALCGAQVVGLDVEDDKLAMLDKLGIRARRSDVFSAVDPERMWDAGRPTVVIDLVGSSESLAWSAGAVATGGTVVVLTTFRNREIALNPRDLVFRESRIVGSRYAGRSEVLAAADLVLSGRVQPIVGAVAGPSDVLELHGKLRERTLLGRGALTWA